MTSRRFFMLGSTVSALLLAACSDSAVAPGGNDVVGSAAFARKPSSDPGKPGDNNSCDNNDSGNKTRNSPKDKNQCGGGSGFFNQVGRVYGLSNKSTACSQYYISQCEVAFDAADGDADNSVRVLSSAVWDSVGFGDPTRWLVSAPKPPRAELFPAFDHSRFSDVSWYSGAGALRMGAIPGFLDLSIDYWTLFIDDDFDLSSTSLIDPCQDAIPYLFVATPTTDYLLVTFDSKQYRIALFGPPLC